MSFLALGLTFEGTLEALGLDAESDGPLALRLPLDFADCFDLPFVSGAGPDCLFLARRPMFLWVLCGQ